jgi:GntR family transcriptional regulator
MSERKLDRTGGQPLWKQLQQELVRRLRAGEFDEVFPGELALVEEYQVSRHTVRQALGKLRADGLIVAERGRQPRVATTPEIRQPMGALYSLFSSVEASGLPQHSVVRALDIRADGVIASRLDLEASIPLVYLEQPWRRIYWTPTSATPASTTNWPRGPVSDSTTVARTSER